MGAVSASVSVRVSVGVSDLVSVCVCVCEQVRACECEFFLKPEAVRPAHIGHYSHRPSPGPATVRVRRRSL